MADKIEFIPAAELPITEAEEVDVLCIENGELKLRAGAGLGGGVTSDIIIRTSCRPDYGSTATALDPSNVTIVSGSHSNVLAAISEGRVPIIIIETFHQPSDGYCFTQSANASVSAYSGTYEYVYDYVSTGSRYTIRIVVADDGTISSVASVDV